MHPTYGDSVALDVGGRPAPLHCGQPWLRRRAHDMRATVSGREYLLRHCGPRKATLERDGDRVVDLFRKLLPKPGTVIRDYAPTADALDATIAVAFGNCLRVGAPSAAGSLSPY
jgi:hypothetical protein